MTLCDTLYTQQHARLCLDSYSLLPNQATLSTSLIMGFSLLKYRRGCWSMPSIDIAARKQTIDMSRIHSCLLLQATDPGWRLKTWQGHTRP